MRYSGSDGREQGSNGRPSRSAAGLLGVAALLSCGLEEPIPAVPGTYELAEGLRVERIRAPLPEDEDESPLLTLVRIDPSRYEPVLLTAHAQGSSRTALQWLREFDLQGVINASMYLPNNRSTGFMVESGHVNNPAVNPAFGGFLAFGPKRPALAPLVFEGVDCEGFDLERLRRDYSSIVQNYRLLDCNGRPTPWRDGKSYTTAAIGLDGDGRLVLVHTGTPCRVNQLASWLCEPEYGLVPAHFVEGGADASLVVQAGGRSLREVGSFESGYGNRSGLRSIPNVIGIRPRP
jgi:hypothetical protein